MKGKSSGRQHFIAFYSTFFLHLQNDEQSTFCLFIDKSVGRERLQDDAWLSNLFRTQIDRPIELNIRKLLSLIKYNDHFY